LSHSASPLIAISRGNLVPVPLAPKNVAQCCHPSQATSSKWSLLRLSTRKIFNLSKNRYQLLSNLEKKKSELTEELMGKFL
jgi:hypothetical protein